MAERTLEQMSQKKVQNTKYMTMYDKIKSVRISKYDTAESVSTCFCTTDVLKNDTRKQV